MTLKWPLNQSRSANGSALEVVGFFVVDSGGHITEVDVVLAEWLGLSQEQVSPGRLSYSSILSLDSLALWEEQWQRVSRQGCVSSFKLTFLRQDGQLWVAQISMTPLRDGSGSVGCIVQPDVTLALGESEERIRHFVDTVPVHLFDMAPDGNLRYVNQPLLEFYGYAGREDEFKKGGWLKDSYPDYMKEFANVIQQALQNQTGCTFETLVRNSQGEYRWCLANAVPSFQANGEFDGLIGVIYDVTDRKQVELELMASEERFRLLADASPAHIYDMAPDGKIRFANQTVRKFYKPELLQEILNGNWHSVVHPDDLERLTQIIGDALAAKAPFQTEERIRVWDGSYRWFLMTGTPSFYSSGEFYGMIGFSFDITALKEAEFALRESEQRFRAMADVSAAHIFEMAPNGDIRFINYTMLEFYSPEQVELLRGGDWYALVHSDDLDNMRALVEQGVKTLKGYRLEARFLNRHGKYRWLLSSVLPSLYPDGSLHGLVGSAIDITERKEMEQALRQSEARWREMANAVPIILWVGNVQGKTIFGNDWLYQYSGLVPEQVLGGAWINGIHPDDQELVLALIRQYSLGEPYGIECRYRRADGVYRWHLTRIVPVKDANGNVLNWYGSSIDIHDRRIMEQELRKARDIAEDASRKKSQFLANMSHELRTPLNAVIGFSDMLNKGLAGPMTEKQGSYVEHIATSGRHLLAMVNDILDISKAEAGKIELFLQYVDLEPFISQIRDVVSYNAQQSGVELAFDMQPGLVGLVADADRLRQIFLNLISNAIKFNHKGGQVSVSLGRSPDHQWMICAIQDNGIGIPADKIDKLFREFYQVDSSIARHYEGTGLGLALTKRLVELHHGTIMVESQVNVGSTFTFKLPLNPYTMGY